MNESSDFIIELRQDKTVITVNLSRATLKEAGEFNIILDNMINQGFKKIIIDLEQVDFIDSTFLGSLVINLKKLKKAGGSIILSNVSQTVSTVVKYTGLNKIFEIHQSKEELLNNIQ